MTRFSPVSNGRPDLPAERQTRILVATDVLSEGQNLQDCGRVLNYDLHWNPVTLIQRYGRVDRITTEHEVIHLHNMLPNAGMDRQIGLTGRLSARAQSFHDLIGWTTPSCNRRSGSAGPASTGLRAARAVADAAAAAGLAAGDTLALTANGSVRQGCRVDAGLTAHPLSHAETARLARCEPGVPAVALPPDINRRVQAALTAFGCRRPATAAAWGGDAGAHHGQRALHRAGTGAAAPRPARRRRPDGYGATACGIHRRTAGRRQRPHRAAAPRRRPRRGPARRPYGTGSPVAGWRRGSNRQRPGGHRRRRNKGSRFNVRNLTRPAGARRNERTLIERGKRTSDPRTTAAATVAATQPEAGHCAGKIKPAVCGNRSHR